MNERVANVAVVAALFGALACGGSTPDAQAPEHEVAEERAENAEEKAEANTERAEDAAEEAEANAEAAEDSAEKAEEAAEETKQ